jgi:hypothetical protein
MRNVVPLVGDLGAHAGTSWRTVEKVSEGCLGLRRVQYESGGVDHVRQRAERGDQRVLAVAPATILPHEPF